MGLIRGISAPVLVAVLVNAVVGAGILGLPASAFALAGSWSILAWALCAVVIGAVALCFAEVGSRFTQTGGPYLYARAAFGPTVGFATGWIAWVSRPITIATIGNLLVGYAAAFWPAAAAGVPRFLVITAFMLALTYVLLIGIRQTALVSSTFTVGKVLVLGGFILLGLPAMEWERISFEVLPDPGSLAACVMLVLFAFAGFELGPVVAGEIRDPRRNLPFGLIAALVIVAVLYILVQIVAIGTLPELASSERPLADAAAVFLGPIGGGTFAFIAMMLLLGTMLTTLLLGTRLLYSFGEQGQLPAFFARVHASRHTPVAAILVTTGIAYLATLFSTFAGALLIATATRVLTYLITCLALIALRRRQTAAPAAFHLPLGVPIAWICSLVLVFLLFQSTARELLMLLAVGAAGVVPWYLFRKREPVLGSDLPR
jgi:basic amino acid/polyamine antiporter, APA family